MPRIAAIAPAFAQHRASQSDITATIGPLITTDPKKLALLGRLHASSRVDYRYFAKPLDWYVEPRSFTETSRVFTEVGTDLAAEALGTALATAGLDPTELDYIVFTSVTGISAPSIDALLVSRLGLRSDIKRVPVYGLGCVAGAAGIARVNDYLVGHPNSVAALVAVELCSLTLQRGDESMANLVASGLFGDGAAAVVMVGDERAKRMPVTGPDVIDTVSRVYPDSETVIGFDITTTGFKIVLTPEVSELVAMHFGDDMTHFLASNDSAIAEIDRWIAHPGGPRVLEAFSHSLGLEEGALDVSWASLARLGNMSSVSVLHILADTIALGGHDDGETAVMFALGPGVSAELVLLRWAT